MISQATRAALVATAFAAAAAPPAQAASFAGPWSVVVTTTRGPCDQSYRYGVMIRGGSVTYLGGGAVSVSGRVNSSGQVNVSVSGNTTPSGPPSSCHGGWSWER